MAKHTQTIRRQIADELLECVRPFCEIGAKRVKKNSYFLLKGVIDHLEIILAIY